MPSALRRQVGRGDTRKSPPLLLSGRCVVPGSARGGATADGKRVATAGVCPDQRVACRGWEEPLREKHIVEIGNCTRRAWARPPVCQTPL